jgi:hypothetical protein
MNDRGISSGRFFFAVSVCPGQMLLGLRNRLCTGIAVPTALDGSKITINFVELLRLNVVVHSGTNSGTLP